MALPVWQGTTTDEQGNIVAGAEVKVVNEATGLDAVLFSDRAGTVGITNPFFADSVGFAQFYTASGEYRVTSTNTATTDTNTWRYTVLSGTAATKDAQTSPTDLTADRTLMTNSVDSNGNIWGASNVEYGSNANGEYWKYPDGLLICANNGILGAALGGGSNTAGFTDAGLGTFPASFIASPKVTVGGFASGNAAISGGPITTTTVIIGLYLLNNSNCSLSYIATGKWK